MSVSSFAGRVVVVAGDTPVLTELIGLLLAAGALVAVVGNAAGADAHANFVADPSDPELWSRVVPHVEQRLGPIDGVVADSAIQPALHDLFAPDLLRRGHGVVLAVGADGDAAEMLTRLARKL